MAAACLHAHLCLRYFFVEDKRSVIRQFRIPDGKGGFYASKLVTSPLSGAALDLQCAIACHATGLMAKFCPPDARRGGMTRNGSASILTLSTRTTPPRRTFAMRPYLARLTAFKRV